MSDESKTALVAVRDHRERVIEALTEHFARGDLEMDDFEARMDRAHQAMTIQALDDLVKDLGPVPAPSQALVARPEAQALDVSRPEQKRVTAILGGVDRKGQWVVPRKLTVTAVMGGVSLDFREAIIGPGVTEVKVRAIMGGVEMLVPPNVAVEAEGIAFLGGFEDVHRAPATPDPDRPLLRISGLAVMGGFDVRTRLPGESGLQAWKRERKERKALKDRNAGMLDARSARQLEDKNEP